jgi:hypothetical protein
MKSNLISMARTARTARAPNTMLFELIIYLSVLEFSEPHPILLPKLIDPNQLIAKKKKVYPS